MKKLSLFLAITILLFPFISNAQFKQERCYDIPDICGHDPVHRGWVQERIYAEFYVLNNNVIVKLSYDNMDQMNTFAYSLGNYIYIDGDGDGEFEEQHELSDNIEVPAWAKVLVPMESIMKKQCVKD